MLLPEARLGRFSRRNSRKFRSGKNPATTIISIIRDEHGLVAAVQMGVLELHIWGCHVDAVEQPDRMVFDFDPDEGLGFAHVRAGANEMRDRLKELKLESFPMVTGGKGVHVVVPLKRGHDWDAHRDFAEAMARVMAAESPDRYVANMSKAKRKGKIFVDYLRNTARRDRDRAVLHALAQGRLCQRAGVVAAAWQK